MALGWPRERVEVIDHDQGRSATTTEGRLGFHYILAELGLDVSDFGGGTVLMTGYPAILGSRSPQGILRAVVDHLTSKERLPNREQLLNDVLSLMACHSAVRAGDLVVREDTPEVHNLVVCTLCSCYPWAVLGLPPTWYKSPAYRSRAVSEPRTVLRELGLELPDTVTVNGFTLFVRVPFLSGH